MATVDEVSSSLASLTNDVNTVRRARRAWQALPLMARTRARALTRRARARAPRQAFVTISGWLVFFMQARRVHRTHAARTRRRAASRPAEL